MHAVDGPLDPLRLRYVSSPAAIATGLLLALPPLFRHVIVFGLALLMLRVVAELAQGNYGLAVDVLVAVALVAVATAVAARRPTVVALDDRGVTVERGGRTSSLPWSRVDVVETASFICLALDFGLVPGFKLGVAFSRRSMADGTAAPLARWVERARARRREPLLAYARISLVVLAVLAFVSIYSLLTPGR